MASYSRGGFKADLDANVGLVVHDRVLPRQEELDFLLTDARGDLRPEAAQANNSDKALRSI